MPEYNEVFQGESNKRGQNSNGVGDYIYVIKYEDLETFAAFPASPTTVEEEVTYETAFVPKSGKSFAKLIGLMGEIPSENQGDEGSKTPMFTYNGFYPGLGPRASFLQNEFNDERVVALVPDKDCKELSFFVLGLECSGALMEVLLMTGKAREGGKKGADVKISSDQATLYHYPASLGVVTTPAP